MKLKKKNLRLEKAGRAGPWAMRTAPWGRRNRLIIMLQGHFRDWENFLLKACVIFHLLDILTLQERLEIGWGKPLLRSNADMRHLLK